MDGLSYESVVWFHNDGTYGARWNGNLYTGTWTYTPGSSRIDIMERILGSADPLHPWSVSAPGTKEGKMRKVQELPCR